MNSIQTIPSPDTSTRIFDFRNHRSTLRQNFRMFERTVFCSNRHFVYISEKTKILSLFSSRNVMPPLEGQFSLKQLTQMALGSPDLGQSHIEILYCVLEILLKKLSCQEETVRVSGFHGQCLQQMLGSCRNAAYDFNHDHLEALSSKFVLLETLEQRVAGLDVKLTQHFDAIRKRHETDRFRCREWGVYTSPCEDQCVWPADEDEPLARLVANATFNRHLVARAAGVVTTRIVAFETKIESLQTGLDQLKQRADAIFKRMALVEPIVGHIEQVRHRIDSNYATFVEAGHEVQAMLNAKLRRIHLPALKKYLKIRFEVVAQHIKALQSSPKACEADKPVFLDEGTCLSCGRSGIVQKPPGIGPTPCSLEERKDIVEDEEIACARRNERCTASTPSSLLKNLRP